MNNRRFLWVLLTPALCFLLITPVPAQAPAAEITGVVTDPTGAVVHSAEVQIKNQETGIEQFAVVSERGRYLFRALPPGSYTLSATAPGFKTMTYTDITIEVAHQARLDFSLQVGQVAEEVTVTGAALAPLLQTEGASVGTVVTEQQVVEMPINGRNFLALAVQAPGVSDGFSGNTQAGISRGTRAGSGYGLAIPKSQRQNYGLSAHGLRGEFTNVQLDGVNTTTVYWNFPSALYPSPDMIREFKVETSNYQSEGRGGGVQLNVATKSGTNEFHGSLFEFAQNRALNARDFFLPQRTAKPDAKYHQFGATFGGPILKGKTFFFFGFQGLRVREAFSRQARVPTALERQGNFSESLPLGQIVRDPRTRRADPDGPGGFATDPFPGNVMDRAVMSPISLAIVQYYPDPTDPGDRQFNYKYAGANPTDSTQWSLRVDHHFADEDTMFVRWTQEPRTANVQRLPYNISEIPFDNLDYAGFNGVVGWNHIFSPTVLNQLRLGYTRWRTGGDGTPSETLLGPGAEIPYPTYDFTPPENRTGIGWFSHFRGGMDEISWGWRGGMMFENSYQLNEKISWTVGDHDVTVGAGYRRNEWYPPVAANQHARFSFRSCYTANAFCANPSGNFDAFGFADWLTGFSFGARHPAPTIQDFSHYFHNAVWDSWVDDQIRISPNVSLSLGLRWSYWGSPRHKRNQLARVETVNGVPSEIVYPKDAPLDAPPPPHIFGQHGCETLGCFLTAPHRKDGPNQFFDVPSNLWQPRASLAITPWGPRTVIRMGYARYFGEFPWVSLARTSNVAPFSFGGWTILTMGGDWDFIQTTAHSIDKGLIPGDAREAFRTPGFSLTDHNYKAPGVDMWTVDIQHQLTKNMVATVGYVGNMAHHLTSFVNHNAPPPSPEPIQPRRPNPEFGRVTYTTFPGVSNYHSLNAQLKRRFSDGLLFNTSYSWAKSLGTVAEYNDQNGGRWNGPPEDYYRLHYGDNSFSFRHSFKAAFIYELPVGRGRPFLADLPSVANVLLGGWQFSGMLRLQSGQRFSVFGGQGLNTDYGPRPNRTCNGNLSLGQRTILRDFDTSCWGPNELFVQGNSGRGILRQRPLKNLDVAIQKYFDLRMISEDARLQFRAEMFNAFNTPFFALPERAFGGFRQSTNFSRIRATQRANRIVQMGLKMVF